MLRRLNAGNTATGIGSTPLLGLSTLTGLKVMWLTTVRFASVTSETRSYLDARIGSTNRALVAVEKTDVCTARIARWSAGSSGWTFMARFVPVSCAVQPLQGVGASGWIKPSVFNCR